MKLTKQKLKQIIKEEMDEFGAGWRDERGDPDDWDHSYDEDES